jgi:hypothetical protein
MIVPGNGSEEETATDCLTRSDWRTRGDPTNNAEFKTRGDAAGDSTGVSLREHALLDDSVACISCKCGMKADRVGMGIRWGFTLYLPHCSLSVDMLLAEHSRLQLKLASSSPS